jgi:DNA end-binding protein Ku
VTAGDRSIGKAGRFQPETFAGGNVVVDLMEALRRSVGGAEPAKASKASKKPRKTASGQMEMLMPIRGQEGQGDAGEEVGAQPQRKSA